MPSYRVQTQGFSGPFDLLLALVTRQRVDIGALSIAEIADQYLAEVERMRDMDLDVASDFILVASTLLDMKAASLVPRDDDGADEDDDLLDELDGLTADEARDVLVARLVAYKQFRNAAAALAARLENEGRMHPRTAGPEPAFLNAQPDYLEGITLRGLAVICADLDSRRQTFLLEAEHIAPKRLPVALTVASVDRVLRARGSLTFSDLLDGEASAENIVVTFLAVLTLFKLGNLTMRQDETFGEIDLVHVEGSEPFEADEAALAEAGEDFE